MSRAWMPFYVGDYLRDTMHLTTHQHGMYILLILHYWEHGGLPDTAVGRGRICNLTPSTWRRHERTISRFFLQPGWRHKRIDEELAKYQKIKEQKQIAGSKGGTETFIRRMNDQAYVRARAGSTAAAAHAAASGPASTKEDIFSSASETETAQEVADKSHGIATPELRSLIQQKRWSAR